MSGVRASGNRFHEKRHWLDIRHSSFVLVMYTFLAVYLGCEINAVSSVGRDTKFEKHSFQYLEYAVGTQISSKL